MQDKGDCRGSGLRHNRKLIAKKKCLFLSFWLKCLQFCFWYLLMVHVASRPMSLQLLLHFVHVYMRPSAISGEEVCSSVNTSRGVYYDFSSSSSFMYINCRLRSCSGTVNAYHTFLSLKSVLLTWRCKVSVSFLQRCTSRTYRVVRFLP